MRKPAKTAAELEAAVKVEIEDICDRPTYIAISVKPDGASWKLDVVQEASEDDSDPREMIERIVARPKGAYDLQG